MQFIGLFQICILYADFISSCPKNCICSTSIFQCSSITFKDIVASVRPSEKTLQITVFNVTEIEDNAFSSLPNLTDLFIIAPSVEHIGDFAFHNLTKLTSLNIRQTQIRNITSKMFEGLFALIGLSLVDNCITHIPHQVFKDSKGLTSLFLSGNYLQIIDDFTFSYLNKLTALSLSENNISYISSKVFHGLKALTYLFLHDNNLMYIAKSSFSDLENLKTLELRHNKLKSINELLTNLSKLMVLSINNNALTRLEKSDFKGNPLLKKLYAQYNQISLIDEDAFRNKINLVELCLANNNLTMMEKGTFSNLYNLRYLNISHNIIYFLEETAFIGSPLVRLDLSHNNLSTLQIGRHTDRQTNTNTLFRRKLVLLDVSNNRIESIHPYLFSDWIGLRYLDLSNNLLESLPKELLLDLMYHLDLRNNKIRCSCYYINSLHKLTTSRSIFADCVRSGKLVDALKITCKDLRSYWNLYQGNNVAEIIDIIGRISNKHFGDQFLITFDLKIIQNGSLNESSNDTTTNISIYVLLERSEFVLHIENLLLSRWNTIEVIQSKRNELYMCLVLVNGRLIQNINNFFLSRNLSSIRVNIQNNYNNHKFYQIKDISMYTRGCSFNNGDCMDQCVENRIIHTAECHCRNGVLQVDGKSCNFDDFIYHFDGNSINRLDNTNSNIIFTLPRSDGYYVSAVAHNYDQGQLFYAEVIEKELLTRLWSYCMLNNSKAIIINIPLIIDQLVYHHISESLYFTTDTGELRQISLKTKVVSTPLSTKLFKPTSVTVGTCGSLIFVADTRRKAVLSILMDGNEERVIISELMNPIALTVDSSTSKLYWADSYYGVIGESNYDGSCQKIITFIPYKNIISMAISNGMLFWLDTTSLNGSKIWRTRIQTGQSDLIKETKNQLYCIRSYLKMVEEPRKVLCPRIKDINSKKIPPDFYAFIILKSQRLPRTQTNLQPIFLSRNVTLCNQVVTNTLYVSPKGYISSTNMMNKNGFVLAVYMSNITNRFIGDVYVTESYDHSIREHVWRDVIKEHKSFSFPDWLFIVTWIDVAIIRNGTSRNTFQAVIASHNNATVTVFSYGRLNEPFGTVGAHCSYDEKKWVRNFEALNNSKLIFLLYSNEDKANELLKQILFFVMLLLIIFIFILSMISCIRRNALKLEETE